MDLLQCIAILHGHSGPRNSCNALSHRPGAVDTGSPAMRYHTTGGQWIAQHRHALPHCLGAVGNGTGAMRCRSAWGQRVVEFVHCTACTPGSSGQWISCNALPH